MLDYPILSGADIADRPMSWPILSHEVLGRGVIQEFGRDIVAVPDGTTMMRDYLHHTGAVGVIAMDDQERIVVVRQYRHPVGFRLLEPPAGLLDAVGEDCVSAAQRELAEEVGVAASDWLVLVDYMTSPGCLQETLRIYLARGLSPVDRPDDYVSEHEEAEMDVCLVGLDDLVAAVFDGRIQNPTMMVGALAAHTAIRTGRLSELRPADAPWPAREAWRERNRTLDGLGR